MNSSLISRPGAGMHVARATRTCNPSRRPALLCRGSAAAAVPAVSNGFVSTIPATAAAAPAISVTVPEPKPAVLPPPLTFKAVAAVGKAKASLPSGRVFTMAVAAGIYIAFGTFFLMCVGGAMPGLAASNPGLHKLVFSLVFPVGLLMVILNAPELYTGNTAITTSAALEGVSLSGCHGSFKFSVNVLPWHCAAPSCGLVN